MRIFVDTGAWVSVAMKKDKNHLAATQVLYRFQQENVSLITSDYVLDEVFTLVRKQSTHENAKRIGTSILKSPVVHLERIDPEVWAKAWRIFLRYKDKVWSFTDCTSFALMDQLNIRAAFTFDRDFVQYGKEVLP
jgi:uncharacterized protein